jgi:hypothetical protein
MMNSVCTMFYPQHLELEQLESSLMMSIFYLLYIKQDNYQKDFYFFFPIKRSHTSRVLDAHPCLPSNKKQISLRLELGDS